MRKPMNRLKAFSKKWMVKCLESSKMGKRFLHYFRLKTTLFEPASGGPFRYLNKFGRKRYIDTVYEDAYNHIFALLKGFSLRGDIYEFGVCAGYSSLVLAKKIKQFYFKGTSLHLFDSFEGLPAAKEQDVHAYEFASGAWKEGSMAVPAGLETCIQAKLAKILSRERVHVVKGFFEETLEGYFKNKKPTKAKLIHIDCDLYSSSKYVLDFVLKQEIVQDGTLLVFDDWMTSLGNPNLGQRKATQEVLEKYPHWSLEKYLSYGMGSHVFIAHDLRVKQGTCENLNT